MPIMNIAPAAELSRLFCKWQVTLVVCSLTSVFWYQVLSQILLSERPSESLLSFVTQCEIWELLGLEISFLLCCVVVGNTLLYLTVGPVTFPEYASIIRRLATKNSFLQLLILAQAQEHLNAVELLLWTAIFTAYTCARGLLCLAESRFQTGRRQGLEKLLYTLSVAVCVFIGATSWCFWDAGLFILLQMHYDGAQLLLQTLGLLLTAKSSSAYFTSMEIRITGLAHGVGLVQWSHFLLAYLKWLGFPIQFFLFYKLTEMIQLLQQDALRYRGFHSSTGLFLQQCPPLSATEVEALGNEHCCMCWEELKDSTCSRLPCGHVHHVDCIRKLMMSSRERKCPLCKQVFLQGAPQPPVQPPLQPPANVDFMRIFAQFAPVPFGLDHAIAMVREVVPQASDAAIRAELERTRSIQQTIVNLVDQ